MKWMHLCLGGPTTKGRKKNLNINWDRSEYDFNKGYLHTSENIAMWNPECAHICIFSHIPNIDV